MASRPEGGVRIRALTPLRALGATLVLLLSPGLAALVVWVLIRIWDSENWGGLFLFPPLFIAISTAGYLLGGRMLGWAAIRVVPRTLLATMMWALLWGVIGFLDPDTGAAGHLGGMLLLLAPATALNIWKAVRRSSESSLRPRRRS